MQLEIPVSRVDDIPKYYGVGYRSLYDDKLLCYPVPLNLVVRYMRELWFWAKYPSATKREQREKEIYLQSLSIAHKKIVEDLKRIL